MLSNLSMLKCRVNENDYQFICDINSQTFEIKAALSEFQKFVLMVEEEARKKELEEKVPEPILSTEESPLEVF